MNYISTRGIAKSASFCEILLEGLAADGGLAVPQSCPRVSDAELEIWRYLSYPELAFEIMRKFVSDIGPRDLRALAIATYQESVFGSREITPLTTLESGLHLLRLSFGPSLAFKDIAMQWLGNLFQYVLETQKRELTILGATSGDTGSAAEYALRGKKSVRVFMLSPFGKMSAFQTAQMYSIEDSNIFNIAIHGVFDDAQDIVKAVNADVAFKARHHIGSVNSINWARIVAQVVYYFKGYFAASESNRQQVSFAVPSGNFGNIYAGHMARMMGLPIAQLVCATNENDVLHEFFQKGRYRVRTTAQTLKTSSPSMDISKASNFERFVFDLFDGDCKEVVKLWTRLGQDGAFDLSQTPQFNGLRERFGIVSCSSTHIDRINTIRAIKAQHDIVVDPHTADGIKGALQYMQKGVPMVALETALPAKFADTIQEALGTPPDRPARFAGIEDRPQHFDELPASAAHVMTYISQRSPGA